MGISLLSSERPDSLCSHGISVDDIEDLQIGHRAVLPGRATAKFLFQLAAGVRAESADRVCSDLAGGSSVLVGVVAWHVLGVGHGDLAVGVHESHLVGC